MVRLSGYVPPQITKAQALGPVSGASTVQIDVTLPLTNTAGLKQALAAMYRRGNPAFMHFLKPAQFISAYAPTLAQVNAVTAWLKTQGLTINRISSNKTVVSASASASRIESAFSLTLNSYKLANGRVVFAPNVGPLVPSTFANEIVGIAGLNNVTSRSSSVLTMKSAKATPHGSGPDGGLSPYDINTAYNLTANNLGLTGAGQEIALIETDGYSPYDIQLYAQQYNLPTPNVTPVLVDTASGLPGPGTLEAETDIELALAVAPRATIAVYETPNTDQGIIDALNQVAQDGQASVVEIGWGSPELSVAISTLSAENTLFTQLAMQGVSVFAAAGDFGAYADGATISVDDPGSQPNLTTVGGTSLTLGALSAYASETSWSDLNLDEGGGGGFSAIWPISSWQSGDIGATSLGSKTYRNLPDVSVNADPLNGYSLMYQGSFSGPVGGTGAAASIWAGITVLVNQKRALLGYGNLGMAAAPIYAIGTSAKYALDFHDIADASTNLFYPAVKGFDDSTGWGTPNGTTLITDLAGLPPVPSTPTSLVATPLSGAVQLTWTASANATAYTVLISQSPTGPFVVKGTSTTAAYKASGLTNGVIYYFEVYASSVTGNSLPTGPVECAPISPSLKITSGPTVVTNQDGSATVSWTTNAPATSSLVFGMDGGALTAVVSDPTYVVAHQLIIPAVMCGDITAFIVTSTDGTASVSSKQVVYIPL
jgi:kumamolisin